MCRMAYLLHSDIFLECPWNWLNSSCGSGRWSGGRPKETTNRASQMPTSYPRRILNGRFTCICMFLSTKACAGMSPFQSKTSPDWWRTCYLLIMAQRYLATHFSCNVSWQDDEQTCLAWLCHNQCHIFWVWFGCVCVHLFAATME